VIAFWQADEPCLPPLVSRTSCCLFSYCQEFKHWGRTPCSGCCFPKFLLDCTQQKYL